MSQHNEPNEYIAGSIDRAASVNHLLEFAEEWLNDPEVTEICVNRPFEVWCERNNVWEKHEVPELSLDTLRALGVATAKFAVNDISDNRPILSAILPGGERIQIVLPPACEHGTISLTIRKPSFNIYTISDYEDQGFFKHVKPVDKNICPNDKKLLELKNNGNYSEFIRQSVELEKVIVVAGKTGSGKTTFMKALMQSIHKNHRIITIEDVPELFLPNHPNHVHLFYPSESDEKSLVTPAKLLKSCLRMKPTRILLAELRGGETFDFVNIAASGHGGSITSIHAGSCDLAFERLALMILQNPQGRTLPYDVIRRLLFMVIDIIIHVDNDESCDANNLGRHITEIWFDPESKKNKQKD